MMPLVTKLRQSYRVLACLDDFLICLDKAGRIAVMRDCRLETRTIDKLLYSLGMARHPTKGEWKGSTQVEHLGCVIDTESMRIGSLCRLSHQAPMDLRTWKRLATVAAEGRPIRPLATNGIMHTDAAGVGFGGTLAFNGNPGDPGTWQDQGFWQWRNAPSASLCEN
jgi:hypothetical protein